ncbi:TPA: O-antigen ligase family protein, partial [Clostridioides difficile]
NKIAVNKNFNIISFLNYMIPLSVFFFYSGLSKYSNIQLLVKSTYMISTIFSYIEFIILDGYFTRFASSGYRVVSIFVNPNNFGIVMVILTVYLLSGETIQKIQNKLFVLINSLILIYLSGSRSAILIITVTGGIYFLNKIFSVVLNKNYINIKNIMYLVIGSLLFIAMLIISRDLLNSTIEYLNSKSRNLQIGLFTGAGRLYQINKFIDVASSNINFPWRNFIIYVDNIYLHIWGMFGLPILILFIFFNIYLLFKTIKKAEYYKTLLIIVFLTAGLSTNIFYLWPIAYIYWYLVGDILYIKSLNF